MAWHPAVLGPVILESAAKPPLWISSAGSINRSFGAMAAHVEATTPSYNPAVSPTHRESTALGLPEHPPRLSTFSHLDLNDSGESKHTTGCSVAMLVLLALPRMATNMAWSAQWAALGPYLGTLLPRFAVQLTQLIGPLGYPRGTDNRRSE